MAKDLTEQQIIKRIKRGQKEYFPLIVNKYKRIVYNHALSFLRNREEADDAAQEIFVNVFRNIKKFRGDSKIGTWIYRITVNVCKNKLKQLKRLRAPIIDEFYEGGEEDAKSLLDLLKEKEEHEPDKQFASVQLKGAIYKRIEELSDEQKNVIIMRDIDGLSYEEIAKTLRISVSAVKSKLFRARENLREKLEKDGIL